jgi:hypothetical protein
MGCDVHSYKASLGCRTCARRAVTGHKGTEIALLRQFEQVKSKLVAARAGKSLKPVVGKSREAIEPSQADPEKTPVARRGRKPKNLSANSAE